MPVDTAILDQLEARGLTQDHLALLLDVLSLGRNGSCCWHYTHGRLAQCDIRVVTPGKAPDLREVRRALEPYAGSKIPSR